MTYISWFSDFALYLRPYLIERRHLVTKTNGGLDNYMYFSVVIVLYIFWTTILVLL